MPAAPRSDGERLVQTYLDGRGLLYAYEAPVGEKNPDFLVQHGGGQCVLEVYEPQFALPRGPDGKPVGGFLDPLRVVRKGLDKWSKSAQAEATLAAGLPFVIVLARTASEWPLDDHNIPPAMFGDLRVVMPFDDGQAGQPEIQFGERGRLDSTRKVGYSAVAAISSFDPGFAAVDRAAAIRMAGRRDPAAHLEVLAEVIDEFKAAGRYVEGAVVVRLRIFHNPFAAIPLPMSFAGPFDDQWAIGDDDGGYCEVSWGISGEAVPSREM